MCIRDSPQKDTLNFWYTPKQKDSLVFTITKQQKIDTFKVRLKEMKNDSLQVENLFSGDLPMHKDFGFKSNIPIVKTDPSKLKVFAGKDSTAVAIPFKTRLDPNNLEFYLSFDKKNDETEEAIFSSRRRHTRCREVSWARRCV